MRKIMFLLVASFSLSGCLMSGPMALLSPTAKYLMWTEEEDQVPPHDGAISVEELLQSARKQAGSKDAPAPLNISYDDYVLNDHWLHKLSPYHDHHFDVICGPYEYGAPVEAALSALKSCSAIQRQMQSKGLRVSVRFDPLATKGQATLLPVPYQGEDDA